MKKNIDILLENELSREEMGSILHTTHFTIFLSSLIYIHTYI